MTATLPAQRTTATDTALLRPSRDELLRQARDMARLADERWSAGETAIALNLESFAGELYRSAMDTP